MKRTLRTRRRAILTHIRRILERTPLDTDCGALCGAACCKGDDAMWLFPGEDELYENVPGLEAIEGEGNLNVPYLRCTLTECDRALRPVSCRIFPYFPMAVRNTRTGKITVRAAMDPRALKVCPLLRRDAPAVTPAFRSAVERAGRLMLGEPSLREYLLRTTGYLLELAQLLPDGSD